MKLKRLLEDMEVIELNINPEIEVRGLNYDSRKVQEGDLFVAIKGLTYDGDDFIHDAIKRGSKAVISERVKPKSIPFIHVPDTRSALALASHNFFGRPSEFLTVVGVTGTNGKTTTVSLIKQILQYAGKKTGLIGTINYEIGEKNYPAPHTTPEAVEFQGLLQEMLNEGCSYAVSEVSSHALTQKRVDSTRFKIAVFTNLTRDHLDFHKTMDDYFNAKKRLFTELLNGVSVINLDDSYGRKLLSHITSEVITYGISSPAELSAYDIEGSSDGLSFKVSYREASYGIESPLIGIPNVHNILSAIGACTSMGIGFNDIREALKNTPIVKGRFEKIALGQDFLCIVDYAHTEDALRGLIHTARQMTCRRVITLFGCGGNRDRGKRPAMGFVATELSDVVFITSDNPRNEDPREIIREIESGIKKKNYYIVPDRSSAITMAIMEAKAGDTVLIAGKGHEDYQEIGGERFPFSDRDIAEEAIKKL